MSLDVRAVVDPGRLDLQFRVDEGETLAVLGPNGAGKSTLLDVVAGLIRPHGGSVRLDDTDLVRIAPGGRDAWVPAHARGIALLSQEALLFPHLSVRDNVAFGPRSAGLSRAESRSAADRWLERVDATGLAARRPSRLSGGQAQRVAVARALATEPRLLLLDEPFGALDAGVAPAMRRLLAEVLAEKTVILVTHDPLDALALADRVIVLGGGRIVEQGPTREVLLDPQTDFTKLLTFGLGAPGAT
ncbi:sulfate/molybdate ABC transporter ATP-binding protein [Agreia sp. COWG]|uniref:sulfate/molybdate ABC transporter ATP-binding protein n=1 Tax=Agreia sp. COWG TaxID=2773266 RepID=UPI0019263FEB|nr:ATP-binding cassette domain-containing protein [Agreia sp. COWG]CAD5995257.1 ABC transporter domain-containing protein [Agreia sp. COWG]